ncbi:Outer membrane protein (porin) [Oryzisolibacter propanilivorax]|uniref:Outer membrane protein (Porin) n=1 Tax=Oryzisolibacter propanilivorax TaxID=1527607 RepID=A0A1G9VBR8_9BURK|nr:porin [Oryzisolibacter propanilivorax]SDM69642.1 Outer membrane protein (porin) [Oryzisolibacter propanilivorax]
MQSSYKNTLALAALMVTTPLLHAQAPGTSKVQLWGIVDAAVRHTNNEGPGQDGKTQMLGGGMSQSRWGINVEEDLGGGSKALVVLENRFNADDGTVSTPFFQLAHVGLQGPYGRITAGRQWNVLFDVVTSTYASFPYSPYMEAYKPELGLAMGARTSNMLKYAIATPDRTWAGALQYSFDENNSTSALEGGLPGSAAQVPDYVRSTLGGGAWKTAGGYLRYAANGLAVGGGFMRTTLPGGTDVDAWTVGGSYRTGPWYFNMGYGLNKAKYAAVTSPLVGFRNTVDRAILGQFWSGQTNGGFLPGDADKRHLIKVGVGYQLTPQLNLGMHYFRGKQSGSTSGAFNGNTNFYVAVADYAFSKRTDAYFGVDHTSISGGSAITLDAVSQARSRTGITVGIRHRF